MANERFISIADELVFGTLPTAGWKRLAASTSSTVGLTRDSVQSQSIIGTRGISNVRPGNDNITGGLNFEVGLTGLEKIWRHVLGVGYSDGATPINATTLTTAPAAGATTFDVAATTGWVVNDFIRIDTLASLKSEVRKITAIAALVITVDFPLTYAHASGVAVTEVASPFTHVFKRSTLPVAFSMQTNFEDITQIYKYSGCRFMNFALAVPQTGLATATTDVRGKTSVRATTATGGTLAVPSFTPYISWEGAVLEGGSAFSKMLGFNLTIDNEIDDSIFVVGSRERVKLPEGRGQATGTMGLLVEDTTILDKFRNETGTTIKITFTNGASSTEIFLPSVIYTGGPGDPTLTSAFGPVRIDGFPIQARYDTTEATDVRVTVIGTEHLM